MEIKNLTNNGTKKDKSGNNGAKSRRKTSVKDRESKLAIKK